MEARGATGALPCLRRGRRLRGRTRHPVPGGNERHGGGINRPAYEERDLQVFPCANGGVSMAFEADEVALVVFRARFELTLFDVSDVLVEVRAVWRVPSRNREGGGQ